MGDGVEVVGGWRGRRYGCLSVLQTCKGGVVVLSLPECMRMKKACKHQFTGLVVIAKTDCVSLGRFQPVYSPSRGAREGGASPSEIE